MDKEQRTQLRDLGFVMYGTRMAECRIEGRALLIVDLIDEGSRVYYRARGTTVMSFFKQVFDDPISAATWLLIESANHG